MLYLPHGLGSRDRGKGTMRDTPYCETCAAEGVEQPDPDGFYQYPSGAYFKLCKRHYAKAQNEARAKRMEQQKEAYNDQRKEADRKYREMNKPKRAELARHQRAKDPQKAASFVKTWEENNPDRAKERKRKNYLRRRAAGGHAPTITVRTDSQSAYAGAVVTVLADDAPPGHVRVLASDGVAFDLRLAEIV